MKPSIVFLVVVVSIPWTSALAELKPVALMQVVDGLKAPVPQQSHRYKWVSSGEKGGKAETQDYGVLVFATSLEKGKLRFHDTITLAASFGGTVFDRRLLYPTNSLLRPEEVIMDIETQGQKVRQLTFTNGVATVIEFSGATNSQKWTFPDGILSFNALLRLAPLLPRDAGTVYTFQAYAEPVLFRVREAAATEVFTLTCDGPESVTIKGKALECVRFRLELKSASIRTDVWVGASNSVVKFRDTLRQRAGATFLEATLQE